MTVYILIGYRDSDWHILGVFKSRAACSTTMMSDWYEEYEIQEWDIEEE